MKEATFRACLVLLAACSSSARRVADLASDASATRDSATLNTKLQDKDAAPANFDATAAPDAHTRSDAVADSGAGADGGGPSKPQPPGCGLASAAFCETFETRGTTLGRAGELDSARWSGAHGNPQLPVAGTTTVPVGPATIGTCRAGLPAQVYPAQDALICEPNDAIPTRHLLVAVGAQNYGQNSYRIRQPFDFEGRTGHIAFDAEGNVYDYLLGWISLAITEDPTPIPGFAIGDPDQTNDEGTAIPRNAVEIHFQAPCPEPGKFTVRFIDVLTDYEDALHEPTEQTCVTGAAGHLNHFEISISRERIEVYASPYSEDGKSFAPVQLLYAADVALPFERGYVQLTTHNHATLKYSVNMDHHAPRLLDAWVARWDNVGFDGPAIDGFREYEVPDSLEMGMDAHNIPGPVMNVGYRVPDAADGARKFTFHSVDVTSVERAAIALSAWYLPTGVTFDKVSVRYRLNQHDWHDRAFTASELRVVTGGRFQGQISQMLQLPVAELAKGDNELELASVQIPQNYPLAVFNLDLVLFQ